MLTRPWIFVSVMLTCTPLALFAQGSSTANVGGTPVSCDAPVQETYCYTVDDSSQFLYTAADGTSLLEMEFFAGGIEEGWDEIFIYDGSTTGDPVLFSGDNGGDLTGILAEATGTDILLEVSSDGTISCGSGDITPDWEWEVRCQNAGPTPTPVTCGNPVEETYCYANDDSTQFLYTADDGTSALIMEFLAGGIEEGWDEIAIYDGSTNGDPVLFSGDNGGDLAGLMAEATGTDILLEVNSDGTISCQSGDITPDWEWEVDCALPEVGATPAPVDFGTVEVGSDPGVQTVTVTNTGTADLVIDQVTEPEAPFSLAGGTCLPSATVAPGESCTIDVMFDPGQTEGTYMSSFDIISNAASSPDTVTVQGVGEPIFAIPALNRIGLVLLGLMLAMVAGLVVWRRQA